MAIQISGTNVINNSREIINIPHANVAGVTTSATLNYTTALNVSGSELINASRRITNPVLLGYAETLNAAGSTGTALTLNIASGNAITATLTGNCTFTFNVGTLTGAISFTLFLTNDATAGRSIVWPASVKWQDSITPTRTSAANATDIWTFVTTNGGTNWYGALSLRNYV
jgi:hypothetical protein